MQNQNELEIALLICQILNGNLLITVFPQPRPSVEARRTPKTNNTKDIILYFKVFTALLTEINTVKLRFVTKVMFTYNLRNVELDLLPVIRHTTCGALNRLQLSVRELTSCTLMYPLTRYHGDGASPAARCVCASRPTACHSRPLDTTQHSAAPSIEIFLKINSQTSISTCYRQSSSRQYL